MVTYFLAWSVHLFTASGGICGLLALREIVDGSPTSALMWMGIAVVIDAVDGTFARRANVKEFASEIDGELLDNLIDFFNYVIVPAVFILLIPTVPSAMREFAAALIIIASAYQFSHRQAKTCDHFFRGFPSYWNLVVCYLFLWRFDHWFNLGLIICLTILSFVPIKYIYPSRLEYFSGNALVRRAVLWGTLIWGGATFAMVFTYPVESPFLDGVVLLYMTSYLGFSIYRTVRPLPVSQ